MIYYVTGSFRHSESWNKIKDTYIYIYMWSKFSPIFFRCKKYMYNPAQIDFDFGQVYIVWWLSYSQVGEKISVEAWILKYRLLN